MSQPTPNPYVHNDLAPTSRFPTHNVHFPNYDTHAHPANTPVPTPSYPPPSYMSQASSPAPPPSSQPPSSQPPPSQHSVNSHTPVAPSPLGQHRFPPPSPLSTPTCAPAGFHISHGAHNVESDPEIDGSESESIVDDEQDLDIDTQDWHHFGQQDIGVVSASTSAQHFQVRFPLNLIIILTPASSSARIIH